MLIRQFRYISSESLCSFDSVQALLKQTIKYLSLPFDLQGICINMKSTAGTKRRDDSIQPRHDITKLTQINKKIR